MTCTDMPTILKHSEDEKFSALYNNNSGFIVNDSIEIIISFHTTSIICWLQQDFVWIIFI